MLDSCMRYEILKRLIDVVASSAALVLLSPVLLAVATAIRMESTGNPLFFQQRVGRYGAVFPLVKFRSMVRDAPHLGSWRTADNDPRITPFGRFIRRTSLDELPQLWNVLTGDMSLVGPRPQTPAQHPLYSHGDWQGRHLVRPGITGLAQVNGRSAITLDKQIEYDLKYATHVSFMMDMHILWLTIVQVVRKAGVN